VGLFAGLLSSTMVMPAMPTGAGGGPAAAMNMMVGMGARGMGAGGGKWGLRLDMSLTEQEMAEVVATLVSSSPVENRIPGPVPGINTR
jgi:hypothetical protein